MVGETAQSRFGDRSPELGVVPVPEAVEDDGPLLPVGDADPFQCSIEGVADEVSSHGLIVMVEVTDDPVVRLRSRRFALPIIQRLDDGGRQGNVAIAPIFGLVPLAVDLDVARMDTGALGLEVYVFPS